MMDQQPDPPEEFRVDQLGVQAADARHETDEAISRAHIAELDQQNRLRQHLFVAAVVFVSVQLGVADALFVWYLAWDMMAAHQTPSGPVMIAWLSATVVEVIGILAIIARYLFPARRSRHPPQ